MIVNIAAGVGAARTGARIDAFLIETRFVVGTFGTDNALGPTCWRRTDIGGQA